MSRYIDAERIRIRYGLKFDGSFNGLMGVAFKEDIDKVPTADVRENITAHKVIGGGEHKGATCWFECDNCGLAVDIGDVFCKHCGARFVP